MSLNYNGKLIPRAKELRKEMTPQEKHLWYDFLRSYPIRFQRQKVIDQFIADFFCHKAKLIIEVDGAPHFTEDGIIYDNERTMILSRYGLKVLRFTNNEINFNFSDVCERIDQTVKDLIEKGSLCHRR